MPVRRRRGATPVIVAMALLAIVAAACGPSARVLSEPVEVLQAGAASLREMRTLHLRGLIEGELRLDLGDAGGGAPLQLEGTTLDAEIDVSNSALAVELLAPALLNMRVSLIAVDGGAYLRVPILTGDGWIRQPAEDGLGGDPGAALAGLAVFLARPELKPERLPDTRCAGTDCYSVRFTVPAEALRAALGTLGSSIPGLSGDAVGDVAVTVGVRRDDLRLVTLGVEIPAGGTAPLKINLELSKVNEPVTIEAPPADEVMGAPS